MVTEGSNNESYLYQVSDIPGAGRGLIAARDIKKGNLFIWCLEWIQISFLRRTHSESYCCWFRQVIKLQITFQNGIWFSGPQTMSNNTTQTGMSQCVQCWKLISQPYTCPRCRLPLCNFNCSLGQSHKLECDILLLVRLKLQASIGNGVFQSWIVHENDIISSILPLRLLTLKWRLVSMFYVFTLELF